MGGLCGSPEVVEIWAQGHISLTAVYIKVSIQTKKPRKLLVSQYQQIHEKLLFTS